MNENVLHGMAALLVRQLGSILKEGALPEGVQVVVRPLYTWPDGQPSVWIMVNWPN